VTRRPITRTTPIFSLLGALILSSISPISAATLPKAGQNCSPINKKITNGSLTLTCKKVGKKIIWVKVVTSKSSAKPSVSPSPSSTGSATPIPTPSPGATQASYTDADFPPNSPAPGRTCPNVNGVAVVFGAKITCIAHGDGGIWTVNPGEVITLPNSKSTPKTTPSPTTSSTPSPVPTTIATSGGSRPSTRVALAAYNDIKNILESAPTPKSTYVMHVSPNASTALVAQANKTLPNAVKFWQSVYSPAKPVDVIYAYWADKDWTIAAVKEAGDTPNGYGGMAAWFDTKPQSSWTGELGSGMHEGIAVNGVTPKIDIVVSGPDAANRAGGMTTAPHEYTHNVQVELAPKYFSTAPCWFSEGMAQYFAIALAYPDSNSYLANRMMVMKDREFGAYPFDSQRSVSEWAAALEAASHGFCGPVGGYWTGTLAVEYLTSLKGTAGIIAFVKELERTGSFDAAFKTIYAMDIATFFTAAGGHIHDTVGELLGNPADITLLPNSIRVVDYENGTLAIVQKAVSDSKAISISPLITLTVEDGALTSAQRSWLEDSLRFMTYISPPSNGAKWNLVFPRTMEWFLKNWDINAEQQRYQDMFANNTAAQLVGSVHSYGTGQGGWNASFFVDPNKNWMNPDWQMRFMAQLLKPIGYSYGLKGPDWFTRSFAYPIGAAYSQITSTGNYASLHKEWLVSLTKLPQPLDVSLYEPATSGDGTENYKAPGSLANEILLNLGGLTQATNFLVDTNANGGNWESQLEKSFGITKAELYSQIAAWNS
jgi:hypothetical protein